MMRTDAPSVFGGRFVPLMLAGIMALSFAACGGSGTAGAAVTDAAATDAASGAETVTESEPAEKIDLGGMEIRVRGYVEAETNGNEFTVDELNGEVINDAVYNRNLAVEQRLNCRIVPNITPKWQAGDEIKKIIQAGEDNFDISFTRSDPSFSAASEGMFIDLFTVDSIDTGKPCWSQGFIASASINNRLYLLSGPMSLGFYRYLMLELFNKNMFERAGFDMPYQTVLDGKWTLDLQNSIASAFYIDLNGDSVRDAGDQYGFVTRRMPDTSINDGYWSSLDLRTILKDENGYYAAGINADSFSTALDHLLALMDGDGTYGMCDNDDDIYKRFTEGLSAMSNARLHIVESAGFRNMSDDYGIIPMPKATEEQARYYTMAQDQIIVYGMPVTVPEDRIEDVGVFLQTFATESGDVVRPAYYETALTEKYMNDEESKQMLNLVIDSLYIDPSALYTSLSPLNVIVLRDILKKGENTIASVIAKNEDRMQAFIDRINEAYGG